MLTAQLRKARPDEHRWLADLIHTAFAGYSARLDAERAPRQRSSKNWVVEAIAAGSVFIFEDAQLPVGAAILSVENGALHIDQIAIDPQAQGKGLGGQLLAAIEDHAKANGFDVILLHTAQPMTELVAFYSRAGYRVFKVAERPTDPDGIPRIYFRKNLS